MRNQFSKREDIGAYGVRHVTEIQNINRKLVEKALFMRCRSYLAQVQTSLLTQTIYEVDKGKKYLSEAHSRLREVRADLERRVELRTAELTKEIHERKRVEQELRQSNDIKNEFLSTAAHEFRTPLTTIRGFSELILIRNLEDPKTIRGYMEKINREAEYLTMVIEDLLDISIMDSKEGPPLCYITQPIRNIIESEAFFIKETFDSHHFVIGNENLDKEWTIDENTLRQVLKNIYSNAAKYSQEGTQVTTTVEDLGDSYRVNIADQGIGMTPEQLERVFESFYRAEENKDVTGTGLGTNIAKRNIEKLGGQIGIESEKNKGTMAWFTVPKTPLNPIDI